MWQGIRMFVRSSVLSPNEDKILSMKRENGLSLGNQSLIDSNRTVAVLSLKRKKKKKIKKDKKKKKKKSTVGLDTDQDLMEV